MEQGRCSPRCPHSGDTVPEGRLKRGASLLLTLKLESAQSQLVFPQVEAGGSLSPEALVSNGTRGRAGAVAV